MKYLNLVKKWSLVVIVVAFFFWIFGANYSFIFKKKVLGEVVAAEKVVAPMTIVATANNSGINPQVFSFSVGIKDKASGEIFMASSEDRQWAAVANGNCVVAAYFPYPPWNLSKANTYHNARLLRNFTNCDQLPEQSAWESFKFFFLF